MDQASRLARAHAINCTTLVGATWNVALSITKIAAGWYGHSQALVADGVHSLSDLASDLLVWFAGRKASEAPDDAHPYGHGRYETLATLGLGILLVAVAIGIGLDAVDRLFDPAALLAPRPVTLLAAVFSIAVKEWLYWYTLGYAKRVGSEMLRANAWHHRSDAISSIVVLIGIGGTMAGLPYLDAVAAVIVALMIAKIAWELGWEAVRELVDTGLDAERLDRVRKVIRDVGGVRDIHMLRTRTHGGRASADVHVLVDPYVSVSEGHLISVLVEQRLKGEIDEMTDVTVHIDPEDDESSPPTMGLPLRADALARLENLWSPIPEVAARKRVLLHYLAGRIEADLFLPLAACPAERGDVHVLIERIREATGADPVFSRVNVYFG